jgi:hypothetical protein
MEKGEAPLGMILGNVLELSDCGLGKVFNESINRCTTMMNLLQAPAVNNRTYLCEDWLATL